MSAGGDADASGEATSALWFIGEMILAYGGCSIRRSQASPGDKALAIAFDPYSS